ncbi:ParB/RepB/Spo0J family partition protein [Halobacillus mangrovi]|uniref:Chromosome partitioning protein ParB n=1 Tax=Halobacillus mangrovi TaxID=402384 RepID=A0A1W5ZQG1_9BACI|nr:ParB/RepB/Spo0J family partition protein [Halobacillus mangrovi]ARI75535.1 chromosome partitioning protein ParB [Halobacillus mangrovi]
MDRGLSKGLGDYAPQGMEPANEEQVQEVNVSECRPNPYQPRRYFEEESLTELKQSIEQHGILQPLIVRKSIKGYEIVVGERRFRAAKLANLVKVPVVARELTDEQMMELALLENLQRDDLTPIEEAKAYQNLMKELGLTQEELAKRLGKSRSHIANFLRLLTLPQEVIQKMNEGMLSMGHGRALLSLKNRDHLRQVVAKIEKEGLNVRQVERLIYEYNLQKNEKKPKEQHKDIFLKEREETLKERLGTSVSIHKGKRKGKIEIEFMNDEDLERILEWFEKDSKT